MSKTIGCNSPKISSITLGCKVNDIDTQAMLNQFSERGYHVNDSFDVPADVYLVNTCTVTNIGDKKSRQMIRRAKQQNPEAIVIAAGCYSQTSPEEVAQVEGVNIVLGNKDRISIVDLVEKYKMKNNDTPYIHVQDIRYETIFEELKITSMGSKTRAFVKIQEGCNEFCSYCIIPFSRGNNRSRPLSNIVKEVEELVSNGYKEIVLSGIHVASYGKDFKNSGDNIVLADVIKAIHDIPNLFRIRLSSIEPMVATPYFLETISKLPKVCDHFHLSLQSGSDKVLKAMNRKYTTKQFFQSVEAIRSIMPDAAITTDIIVGFPGESNADFLDTLDFVQKIGFASIHIFPYSSKKGTRAALFTEQIDPQTKSMRVKILGDIDKLGRRSFANKFVGKPLSVLFESKDEDNYDGYSTNYIKVTAKSKENLVNQVANVSITKSIEELAFGKVEDFNIKSEENADLISKVYEYHMAMLQNTTKSEA